MRKTLIAGSLIVAVACGLAVAGQETTPWEVPDEAKAVQNPVEGSPEAVAAGAALYEKHCVMCHGESGLGDGPATKFVKPAPPNITTAEARARMSDGEMFYKITTGKKPMPPMDRKMNETERWQVIHFVRSLQSK